MIFAEHNFHPTIRGEELRRLLRVPADYVFSGPMADNLQWTEAWFAEHARPWVGAVELPRGEVEDETVRLGTAILQSRELARRLRAATGMVLVAASAGGEAETEAARRWAAEEPDRYYFLETYASAVVEALIAEARARLCARSDARGEVLLPHYSPGYQGWTAADNVELHRWWRAGGGEGAARLDVWPSGMLKPKKSQLALFGAAPAGSVPHEGADLVPCKYCAHVRCEFRREEYRVA